MDMYLAVDIGGSKTLLGVFDEAGELKETRKFKTPLKYPAFLSDLTKNVAKLSTKSFHAAGVGVPARLDRRQGTAIGFGNLPWENIPIQADIAAIVHSPVTIENDSKLAGLSEAQLVKGEFNKVLYLTVSTGISDALVVNGHLDPNLLDSEPGQMVLEHEGQLKRWEQFASGRAIYQQFGKRASDINDPQAWYIISRNIAIGLIDLIATLTPEVVIIGGGVGSHLEKFQDRLVEELNIYENHMFSVPTIRKAIRPETAVIYGAYELVKGHHA
ncbi:MAG: hypothetical protein JWS12_18 [Candidatus Saccharibacteria bacterium]|nr:hypothetical protein [Candidatus Saccharibacteria bacterium]